MSTQSKAVNFLKDVNINTAILGILVGLGAWTVQTTRRTEINVAVMMSKVTEHDTALVDIRSRQTSLEIELTKLRAFILAKEKISARDFEGGSEP